MISNGKYNAVCVAADLGTTSTGKEQVALTFSITEPGEALGQEITYYGYFTAETLKHTIKALRACGWKGTRIDDLSTAISGSGGLEVALVIEQEPTRDGSGMRPRVRWVNPPGGGAALKDPMSLDQKALFAKKLENIFAASLKDPELRERTDAPVAKSVCPDCKHANGQHNKACPSAAPPVARDVEGDPFDPASYGIDTGDKRTPF